MNLSGQPRSRRAYLAALGWCLLAAGCASTETAPTPPVETRLVVENLTDYEWHIAVTATAGAESRSARVPARSSVEMNLAGGGYVIEQAVVSENAGPDLSRRQLVRLEPRLTYHWRLVTLLSEPAGATGRDRR